MTHGFIEEMMKCGKNASDVTSAAIRLSRAYTGRDLVAVCADHPCALVYATLDAKRDTSPHVHNGSSRNRQAAS
jgi:glutamate-1-semialdehyde aminotransferase